MNSANIQYDEQKLIEMVLYIGAKCALDEHYGVLKLNKILFYSDFKAYRALGKSITGAVYKKYPHGPAPHVMKSLREKLVHTDQAFEYKNPLPYLSPDGEPMNEKRLLPKRAPDMTKISQAEMSIVDSVIEWLRAKTGIGVSKMSHKHPGWALSDLEEVIPYWSELLVDGSRPLSKKDLARAVAIADRYEAGKQMQASA